MLNHAERVGEGWRLEQEFMCQRFLRFWRCLGVRGWGGLRWLPRFPGAWKMHQAAR